MITRIISAVILAPLFLYITYLGGKFLATVIVLLALLALREYRQIGQKAGWSSQMVSPFVLCTVWLVIFWLGYTKWLLPVFFLCVAIMIGLYVWRYPQISYMEIVFHTTAFLYPVAFFTYFYHLRILPHGYWWCLLAIFGVWATDSGAYLIGTAVGKHKFAPQVSPKKSVEGCVAGVVVALLFGCGFWWYTKAASLPLILILTLGISLVGQLGDLFESALKRTAGIKDSGWIIPGHGGILDRFDSFLFAMPFAYYFLLWM